MREKRILIVDDDADIRANMTDILGAVGYRTSVAASGPEALKLLEEHRFEVALLDLKMDGMDGVELYRNIRRLYPETEAFLVSAYTGDGVAEEAVELGILRVFRKPVDVNELISSIDKALARALVLVVDGDVDMTEKLRQKLHQHGYRVGVAVTENDALQHLHSTTYDIVLLDIDNREVDPLRVLSESLELNPDAQAWIVSGSEANHQAIEQLLARGASGVYYKPLDLLGLLDGLSRPK